MHDADHCYHGATRLTRDKSRRSGFYSAHLRASNPSVYSSQLRDSPLSRQVLSGDTPQAICSSIFHIIPSWPWASSIFIDNIPSRFSSVPGIRGRDPPAALLAAARPSVLRHVWAGVAAVCFILCLRAIPAFLCPSPSGLCSTVQPSSCSATVVYTTTTIRSTAGGLQAILFQAVTSSPASRKFRPRNLR